MRLSWDGYFMKVASVVAERSTCLRHNMGALIVKDKRILTTGYNGAAKNRKDCLLLGCLKDKLKLCSGTGHSKCRGVHAEQNAILQAAFYGVSIDGSVLYCTHTPCGVCAKLISNVGIKEVVSYNIYTDKESMEYLKECGISLRIISRPNNIIQFKD